MKSIVSIIIPTYNRRNTIKTSIESVINQTLDNWELIIVDDGSTDNTKDFINEYLIDKRIKYISQDNKGVSAARNLGAELATGDYIIFLDSDDFFYPELLSSLSKSSFYKFDCICWRIKKNVDNEKWVWKPVKLGKMYGRLKATFLAGSICYRKEVFFMVGGYDSAMSFGENYELGLRISQYKGLNIKIIDQELMEQVLITENRTSNSFENRLYSYFHLYKKHKEAFKKDWIAHSKMYYFIGYVLEKYGKNNFALIMFRNAFRINPFNLKAFLKLIYLNFKRIAKS